MRATRKVRGVAALVTLAAIATCCSRSEDTATAERPELPGTTAEVGADGARVATAAGVTVEVPAGAATGGTLAITDEGESPEVDDAGSLEGGEAVDITLRGGELTGAATITFPRPADPSEDAPLFVQTFDEQAKAWVPLPLEDITAGEEAVSVTVEHFSRYRPSWLSTDKIGEKFRNAFFFVFGDGLAGAQKPTCPRDADTLEKFRWESSNSDTLFWCVGTNDDGTVVLNVANNNRYPISFTKPRGTRVLGKFNDNDSLVGSAAVSFEQAGSGQIVLSPRAGMTLVLEGGTAASYRLHSDFTFLTWVIGALGAGIDMYWSVWKAITPIADRDLYLRFVDAMDSTACVLELAKRVLDAGDDSLAAIRHWMAVVLDCAQDVALAAAKSGGVVANALSSAFAAVAGPLLAAGESLVGALELSIDSVRRRATYNLRLDPRPAPPPPANAAPPPTPAPQAGGPCGTVTSTIGTPIEVHVEGGVGCAEALEIADRYYNDPTLGHEGSSGYADVGEWGCASTSGTHTEMTGEAGSCDRKSDNARIELRVP